MHDMASGNEYIVALSDVLSGTTASTGDWIDMQGFDALTLVFQTAAVTDAGDASGFTFSIEEGDTTADADATAIAAADYTLSVGSLTVTDDADDNKSVGVVIYRGTKRYVRVAGTGTTGTNARVLVTAILGKAAVQGAATLGTGTAAT